MLACYNYQMSEREDLPQPIKDAFGHFFEMGAEAQDLALPLIEEAMIERGRNFPASGFSAANPREVAEKRWTEYISQLGDRLATRLDPAYWPGHGGNIEPVIVARSHFLRIFSNQTAETLLQTKELIEKTLGK